MILETQNLEETRALSLVAAYAFGAEKGLQKEVDEIRNMGIDMGHSSSVRRGYIIQLFQSKGIFDEFCQKHWSNYQTNEGKRLGRWYQKKAEEYQRYLNGGEKEDTKGGEEKEISEFVYETDLRDFLAQHLDKLEKGLVLYK